MIEQLRRNSSKPEKTRKEKLSLRRKVMGFIAGLGMLIGAAHLANAEGGSSCDPIMDNGCIENPENPTESTTPLTKPSVPVTTESTVPVTTESTVPVTTESTVPVTTESTVPVTTESTVPVTTESTTTTTIISQPPGMPPTTIEIKGPAKPTE